MPRRICIHCGHAADYFEETDGHGEVDVCACCLDYVTHDECESVQVSAA